MPMTAQQTTVDPLGAFAAGAFVQGTRRPVPLVSTVFDVTIDGGLATVSTNRVFRNDEARSIEATITFPVPVHAVLFDLEARIDGRVLKAKAEKKAAARETYEDAIDRGKAAVLHEEVLRGVHMLSLAHIAPGTEIEVRAVWAQTLSFAGNAAALRIPLTVGDIYGRSGLPDSDDLIHGGAAQDGELAVRCRDGEVRLRDGRLVEGKAMIPLNAPIDLVISGYAPRPVTGTAADGRTVTLKIEPLGAADSPLDVAILVDRSGSMAQACDGSEPRIDQHQAVIFGLRKVAHDLDKADRVDLWEFDNTVTHIGTTTQANVGRNDETAPDNAGQFLALIDRMSGPGGGTEIGSALGHVIVATPARDILLVTDGKSHALDVQQLAGAGKRISVVLVGEDSLEANVGHLAALTGGDILVAAGATIETALSAVLGGLRTPCENPARLDGEFASLTAIRGNAMIGAVWQEARETLEQTEQASAVAAVAASLALAFLDEDRAGHLAEAEGLVTHLTSLVLVDEAGEAQAGIPASRKVALPRPGVAGFAGSMFMVRRSFSISEDAYCAKEDPALRKVRQILTLGMENPAASAKQHRANQALADVNLDWGTVEPSRILAGDLSDLSSDQVRAVRRAAAGSDVTDLADALGVDAVVLVIAMLAAADRTGNRTASRIARSLLGAAGPEQLVAARTIARRQGLFLRTDFLIGDNASGRSGDDLPRG